MLPILFMSPSCGACQQQKKYLSQFPPFRVVNVDNFPNKFQFIQAIPTWAFPMGNEKYRIHEGIIESPQQFSFGKKRKARRSVRRSRFGANDDVVNPLAVYGKNFPNGQGFSSSNSYYGTVEKTWGTGNDTLNAGIGGTRSLGPDNVGQMYSDGYFNNIRMAHPSDQLGTALYLNRTCNQSGSTTSKPGMIFDSKNPQITGFGKRRSRFGGNLYSQMGPASEIGNQYLINQNTGKQLYGGALQNENNRPYGVTGGYISQAPKYNPLGKSSTFSFGKKKKAVKAKTSKVSAITGKKAVNIKISVKRRGNGFGKKKKAVPREGSVLRIKNGKVKVKV
jgi:hypothetical protein